MPRVNIHIRNEDLETWNHIENKSAWLSGALKAWDNDEFGVEIAAAQNKRVTIADVVKGTPEAQKVVKKALEQSIQNQQSLKDQSERIEKAKALLCPHGKLWKQCSEVKCVQAVRMNLI